MNDISALSRNEKNEIAGYIKRDNLDLVNSGIGEIEFKESFYLQYVKRGFDIIFSLIAIIITSPINIVIGVITFFDVGRPIIFRQTRVGKNQEEFTIYKFRNMTNETDENGVLLPPGKRVTRWGRFVRRTSLDELMNFISILNGSMSFIGPRPLVSYYPERMNKRHLMIYSVRPGLECPTVHKVNAPVSWEERFENYVWYVQNVSFLVDLKMCWRLVQMVFDRKSSKQRGEASHGGFLGYDAEGHVIYTKEVPDKYIEEFCKANGFRNIEEALQNRE